MFTKCLALFTLFFNCCCVLGNIWLFFFFLLPPVTMMDQYGGHPAACESLCWAHLLVGTLVLLRQSIMVPGLMVPGRGWDRPERTVPANVRPPPPPLPSDLRDCAGAWVLCAADPIRADGSRGHAQRAPNGRLKKPPSGPCVSQGLLLRFQPTPCWKGSSLCTERYKHWWEGERGGWRGGRESVPHLLQP